MLCYSFSVTLKGTETFAGFLIAASSKADPKEEDFVGSFDVAAKTQQRCSDKVSNNITCIMLNILPVYVALLELAIGRT